MSQDTYDFLGPNFWLLNFPHLLFMGRGWERYQVKFKKIFEDLLRDIVINACTWFGGRLGAVMKLRVAALIKLQSLIELIFSVVLNIRLFFDGILCSFFSFMGIVKFHPNISYIFIHTHIHTEPHTYSALTYICVCVYMLAIIFTIMNACMNIYFRYI